AAQKLKRRFDHVLVDEFQDTNLLQYELVRLLASGTRNLCVVGDDDQSIYRWRGADRRNILGFRRDYPDATVVKLEQNYRSTSNVVKAALAVIEPSADREPKELWTDNEPGAPLEVIAVRDEHEEAAYVVQTLSGLREEGQDLRDTAVFYRVHAQSRVLEESLRAARIPYRIVGGVKFFERAEIKDALAYLRVVVNDKSDVDLLRIINVPARGIGQATLDRLSSFASSRGISVYEALSHADDAPDITGAPLKKLRAVRELLAALKKACAEKSPTDALIHVLDTTGYLVALQEDGSVEATSRLENLRELVGSVRDYEVEAVSAGEQATLEGFLERVTLRTDGDETTDGGSVTLMTVHAAKGLEFRNVIIAGMEEDMFPYRSLQGTRPDDVEEERRLAYVAITRARERLSLVHARERQIFGSTRWGRPSRFLSDIPPELMVQRATPGASTESMRFIDRAPRTAPPSGAFQEDDWRHPQSVRASLKPHPVPRAEQQLGGRYVDSDFFSDDSSGDAGDHALRRGARVKHERFGEGVVREVLQSSDPAVVAFFPSWGEKKVLLRYLRPA
ncbi:MAG TPA: 3'-5' exonuclease, partial [Polyangiaceae bacterium]|nr:3'-5' exonuclease [Polyangiaceae bacterium]